MQVSGSFFPETVVVHDTPYEGLRWTYRIRLDDDASLWLTAEQARSLWSELGAHLQSAEGSGITPLTEAQEARVSREQYDDMVAQRDYLTAQRDKAEFLLDEKTKLLEEWRTKAEACQERLERRIATEDRRKIPMNDKFWNTYNGPLRRFAFWSDRRKS